MISTPLENAFLLFNYMLFCFGLRIINCALLVSFHSELLFLFELIETLEHYVLALTVSIDTLCTQLLARGLLCNVLIGL